jgi:hypothetical protein
MSTTDILLVVLGTGILALGFLIFKKVREFDSPPPEEDEISERVRRLIAESGAKSEETESLDDETPPDSGS